MKLTFEDFCKDIREVSEEYTEDCRTAFNYLSKPSTILSMATAIDMGFSPISAVCKNLEGLIDCSRVPVRQMIGLEMSYILQQFGYKPIKSKGNTRIRKVCTGRYFSTGLEYEKAENSKYKFVVSITENGGN